MKTVRSIIDSFVWDHLEYFTDLVYKGEKVSPSR